MFADKTETLELYISILGLDKRYERTLTTLELHEELALTGTVSVGRRIEEGIGRREKEEMVLFSSSSFIDRSPKRGGKDLITKETDPFSLDDQKFRRSISKPLRMSVRIYFTVLPRGRLSEFYKI